ncbi:MAG TPA: RHS repeat-associated core domain-containing protein [Solirubrobacteraceae bacterium]|nr:RHS repeat-associated core domain-containing protein [Solirubrobacteraceae bacterium]
MAAIGLLVATAPGGSAGITGNEPSVASAGSVSGVLSVPGVQALDGGEQQQDQLVADRANPIAVRERSLSRTDYEHLGPQAVLRAIDKAAPSVVKTPLPGVDHIPAGARVSRYLGEGVARVELAGGKRALVESMMPIATRTSSGRYVPVDLALHESSQGFAADDPATSVSIPRSLGSGVRLAASGVSLTPVSGSGAPLSGTGNLDGGAVVYPNTTTDTDTAAKPTSTGFEVYDTLRSVASPQTLSYRVGMPAGASLRRGSSASAPVSVVAYGSTLASIPAATAVDAEGAEVPVATSVSGHTLKLVVDHRAGDYRYPIVVDPTVNDGHLTGSYSDWRFVSGGGGNHGFGPNAGGIEVKWALANEWGALVYPTQGESHIFELYMETAASTTNAVENHLAIAGPPPGGSEYQKAAWEGSLALPKSYGRSGATVCVSSCSGGSAGNVAMYWVNAIENGPLYGGQVTPYAAEVLIGQNNGPSVAVDTTHELEHGTWGSHNIFFGSGGWLSEQNSNTALFEESDPGVGVSSVEYTIAGKKWTRNMECYVQCPLKASTGVGLGYMSGVPDGEPTIEFKAFDAMGSSAVTTAKLKVDSTAPHEITLSGLPSGNEVNDATRNLKLVAHATDGTTGTPSSGVASIALADGGNEIGSPNGSCSPGPCTATGEWTINGEEFAAGKHTFTVTATDAAGNHAASEITVTVHHAAPVAVGPGKLNPVTGEFDLEETDASVTTTGSPLTLTRSYNSREPGAGAESSFGAPWSMSFGGAQKLVRGRGYEMTLVATDGSETVFGFKGGGKFESPPGDSNLVLKANAAETEYTLTDKGTNTVFTHVSGDSLSVWRASFASAVAGTSTTQYTYQVVSGVLEPLQELGPVPAGVSCTPSLKPGCRALTFNYATSTTATGEGPSEWGDYKGRLTRVYFATAEEKEGKTVQVTKAIAQYAYDSRGRLRAVWDPRISPALKTTYAYDAEGHVVASTPAGEESSIFLYGTTAADTTPGRMIKLVRPPAETALWNGSAPVNTAAPALSGSTLVNVQLGVSNGTWSNGPVAYGYQWEQCNSSGAECKVVPGATNDTYTPVAADAGHKMEARVTAINGGGAVVAVTTPSAAIATAVSGASSLSQSVSSSSFSAVSCVPESTTCAASDAKGNVYYATNVSSGSPATWHTWTGPGTSPSQALSCPQAYLCVVADGEKGGAGGTLYYGAMGGSWTQAYNPANGVDAISCPLTSLCVAGQDNNGNFAYSTNPASTSWTQREPGLSGRSIKGVSCPASFSCVSVDSAGDLHLATSMAQLESSSWTETNIDGTTSLTGIYCINQELCVAVDAAGNALKLEIKSGVVTVSKQSIDTGNSFTAVTCNVRCVAVDDHGNIFISRTGGRTWIDTYQLGDHLTSVSCASYAICAAVDTTGHLITFNPSTAFTEGEGNRLVWGTVIQYNVPVSGSAAPYSLGSTEASTWAQTDVPVEGTAIFPAWKAKRWPEPYELWPASSYKGATVDYFDASDRLVDVAEPTGGIATSEYNSYGDVVRSLSADDRETALKEGSKSAEVSQTLDTQSTYGSEGTELLSTLGPLHTVKLANGTTVKARKHKVYSYDEGAPAGGPYKLLTKVTEGAQIAGEPEADIRTTVDSYGGQNGLGWILRKPTATRVDPSGLDLVHSAVYDPSSGKVTETRTPGAAAPGEEVLSGYIYKSSFGSYGSGSGQMSEPSGIAQDSEGNLFVVDTGNNRIDEFSSGGTFIKKFGGKGWSEGELKKPQGITIDRNGTIWVANSGENVVGAFSKEGKYLTSVGIALKRPEAVAYSSYNGRLYIADSEDSRVEWINPEKEAEFGIFGSEGKGNGQFESPEGIAVDPSGNVWVSDTGDSRVEEFSAAGVYMSQFGHLGEGTGAMQEPMGIAFDSEGDLLVDDSENRRVEVFSSSGTYKLQFGNSGTGKEQIEDSYGLVLDSSGDAYVVDRKGWVDEWVPAALSHESHGTGGTHGMQTIYYSAGSNSEVSGCGNEPAWAGLPCEKRPAAQPETSGVPNLPVTTVTYNIWDEPLVSTETVGSTTRTNTNVYDEAGRPSKRTLSSSVGTALPSVEYAYNSETGALTKSSTTAEGVTRNIESTYDRLGELVFYTDADGHSTTYEYDNGRLYALRESGESYEEEYEYSNAGLISGIYDSATGYLTAGYDLEGNLTAEGYPNRMTANRTYDSTGREVGIEYVKTTHCTTGCVWYSETEYPSIHGQTLSQASTLSNQAYVYDAAGRLTTAQDTPAGEGCTTRIYGYEQETNITSLTTRTPGSGGKCATEGGTAVNHSYDSANRLTDPGMEYNTFGDITKLPAADAGGSALTSTFYVDGTLASQSQNGETIGYNLDPAGRDREIVSTGTTNSTLTYAYDDESDQPAWTEDTSGKTTRNVYGFEGSLVATQNGTESPVLQIEDLHRNIVGTASLSETATGLLSKSDTTEYGVPRTSSPPRYSWQGVFALRTELPSGVIAMGARSYVPGIARFLQPDPVEGGSANEYAYTYGDPVGSADPSGEYTVATPGWLGAFLNEEAEAATEAAIRRAAEEQAARIEAEENAREASEEASEGSFGGGGSGRGKVNPSILMMHYFSHDESPPECLDFFKIGGPIINTHYCGSHHLYYHMVRTKAEEEFIHEHHVMQELVDAGTEVFKSLNEAAKAAGVGWKELDETLGQFMDLFG